MTDDEKQERGFYAIFRRIHGDDYLQEPTLEQAEKSAKRKAECEPQHEFYVMKTLSKFAAKPPEIIHTKTETPK